MTTQEKLEQNGTAKVEEQPPPFPLTERDKWLLSISDEEFKPHIHTWDNLKHIIGE
jgi:hypothetical protein